MITNLSHAAVTSIGNAYKLGDFALRLSPAKSEESPPLPDIIPARLLDYQIPFLKFFLQLILLFEHLHLWAYCFLNNPKGTTIYNDL